MSSSDNLAVPGPSRLNTRKRKRPLNQAELEYYINNLSDTDSEKNDFSSDDSIRDENYVPSDDESLSGNLHNINVEDEELEPSADEDAGTPENATENTTTAASDSDTDWTDTEGDPPNIPFTGIPSFNTNLDRNAKPIDYFRLFFDPNIFNIIVTETNIRAQQQIIQNTAANTRAKKSQKWEDVTLSEINTFIGLCLLSGTIHFPSLSKQWSTNSLYFHPIFGKHMSRNRFSQILRMLRFVNHDNVDKSDRLYKIKPILENVLLNIKKVASPVQQLSIDESMILWRGRLIFRQYISNKRHKYGIKLYELTTFDGFILNILIYTGKGTLNNTNKNNSHTFQVVTELLKDYLNKGHEVYLDNYYNSVSLAEHLFKNQTTLVGTLRQNRKGNPKELFKKKLKKGEATWKRKGSVLVTNWRDKRYVTMISTKHKHNMTEAKNRRGESKIKPECVTDYNRYMSGIDRSDQMMSYYSTPRKTLRWYRKIFFQLIDICIWNGYHIYKKEANKKNLQFLEFRENVITDLLQMDDKANTNQTPKPPTHFHYLEPVPPTPKDKSAMKRCRECSKNKVQKKSRYHCTMCPDAPGLCIYPCFKLWHETN